MQLASCNWAAGGDEELATSQLLHYGWLRLEDNHEIPGASIYHLTKTSEGILVEMAYTHTFQDRLEAACNAILSEVDRRKQYNIKITMDKVLPIGMKTFFWYRNTFTSVPKSFTAVIKSKIIEFISNIINPLQENYIYYPTIEEPEDILQDQSFLLRWEDFSFEKPPPSELKIEHCKDMAANTSKEALLSKIQSLPRDTIITTQDLKNCNINNRLITSAVNHNFITRVKRGQYIIRVPQP